MINVDSCDPSALGPGLSRDEAISRMHIRLADGRLLGGAAALAAMWRNMPGLRWLGQLLAIPPMGVIAEIGYRVFLVVRRLWR